MDKYAVVEFIEEKSIAAIPAGWLSPHKTRAKWPINISHSKKNKALAGEYNLNTGEWIDAPIRILGTADTRASALLKVRRSEHTSNVDSSDNNESSQKRKRRVPSRFDTSDESDNSIDECERMGDYEQININKRSKKTYVPDFPSFSSPLARKDKNSQKSEPTNINDKRRHNFEGFMPNQLAENEEMNEQIILSAKSFRNFQKKVFTVLEDIKYEIKSIRKELKTLSQAKEIPISEGAEDMPVFPFPLSNLEELKKLDDELKDASFFQNMVLFLSKIGGRSYTDTTFNVMAKVIKNDLAKQFSFHGKKGKLPFKNFTISKVIINAIAKSSNATNFEIEKRIGVFLATSGDRDGGRKKRKIEYNFDKNNC